MKRKLMGDAQNLSRNRTELYGKRLRSRIWAQAERRQPVGPGVDASDPYDLDRDGVGCNP